jgi:hypothetical protein
MMVAMMVMMSFGVRCSAYAGASYRQSIDLSAVMSGATISLLSDLISMWPGFTNGGHLIIYNPYTACLNLSSLKWHYRGFASLNLHIWTSVPPP